MENAKRLLPERTISAEPNIKVVRLFCTVIVSDTRPKKEPSDLSSQNQGANDADKIIRSMDDFQLCVCWYYARKYTLLVCIM